MKNAQRLCGIGLLSVATMAVAGYVIAGASSAHDGTAPETAETPDDRARLRAFYTAPPMIPHAVDHQGNNQCAFCHEKVRHIGDRVTVPSPHAEFQNCQQCHVGISTLNAGEPAPAVASRWIGLREPREGDRATETSPPTIPHRLFLRENCNACHAPEHPNEAMRGPHPERTSCRQCHVSDHDAEFGGTP